MGLVARALLVLSALAGVASGASCVACNDIGCDAGLVWTGSPIDGSTFVPGDYLVTLVVEEATYELTCTVATTGHRDSECTSTDGDFEVFADFTPRQSGDEWDPNAPLESLTITMFDDDVTDSDRDRSMRGPAEVAITVAYADRTLVDDQFAPEYRRDEEFWGDERCGFCDERVDVTSEWMP
jgi:hypothetical protein